MPRLMQLPRNLPLFALLCLLVLAAGGCRKIFNRRLTGTVVDATTGEPVPNATVYLAADGASGSFSSPTGLAKCTTDARGRFDLGLGPHNREWSGWLLAYHPHYFAPSDGGVPAYKGDHDLVVPIEPTAYLRLHVKNVPPIKPQSVYVNIDRIKKGFDYWPNLDTTIVGPVNGNQQLDVVYVVGNRDIGEVPEVHHVAVQSSHFDTTNVEILY